MKERGTNTTRITEAIRVIANEAKSAVNSAFRRSGAESLLENLKETIQSAVSSRKNVVMVRLDRDSLKRVDDLVEAGVVSSRSEAFALFIGEGIKARAELLGRISEKVEKIRAAKQELRDLLGEPLSQGAAEA